MKQCERKWKNLKVKTHGRPFDGQRFQSRGRTALLSMWVFCCKHFPDGSIHKLKACLCVCDDKQVKGVDVFKSYSPVVHWTTVHLILIIVILLNWTTVQTGYTNAFAQAPLSKEIYMKIPKDFTTCDVDHNYVLCMNKSLYGL